MARKFTGQLLIPGLHHARVVTNVSGNCPVGQTRLTVHMALNFIVVIYADKLDDVMQLRT